MNELSKAEEARRQAADLLAAAETRQREADRIAATALSELAETREKRGRAEERLVSAREKRVEVEARIREALNCAPHEVMRLTGLAGRRRSAGHAPDRARAGAAEDRARAPGRGQPAGRGRTEGTVRQARRHAEGAGGRDRRDPQAALGDPEPQSRGPRAPACRLRRGQRPVPAAVYPSLRRRYGRTAADRERRSARCRP